MGKTALTDMIQWWYHLYTSSSDIAEKTRCRVG